MHLSLLPLALVIASGLVGAQRSSIDLPSDLPNGEGNRETTMFGGVGSGRVQHIIAADAVAKANATIREVHLRTGGLNFKVLLGPVPPVPKLNLYVGQTSKTPATLSATFGQNRGSVHTLLFSGAFNHALDIPQGFHHQWKLSAPFVFVNSRGSLLLEWELPNSPAGRTNYGFDLHDYRSVYGTAEPYGWRGPFSAGEYNLQCWANNTRLEIGGTAEFRVANFTKTYPSIVAFGFSKSKFGVLALPIHLNSFGAPSQYLHTSLDLLLPGTWKKGGSSSELSASVPIPNRPELRGAKLYAQGLCVDPAANSLGLAVTGALELTVARDLPIHSMVWNPLTNASTGQLDLGAGYVLRLVGMFP